MLSRRGLFTGLLAAPAIIAIDRLMHVKSLFNDSILMSYKIRVVGDVGFYYCPYIPLQMVSFEGNKIDFTPISPTHFITRYDPTKANMIKQL